MVRGHMTVGVLGTDLLVRVGLDAYEDALTRPSARPMDFTGKPSRSMVFVAAEGLDDASLESWVGRGFAFTATPAQVSEPWIAAAHRLLSPLLGGRPKAA